MKKALFIRLDKIGDLIATLPVDQIPGIANYEIKWVIAEGLGLIAEHSQPKRNYLELSIKKTDWQKSFSKLLHFLKSEKPDSVLIFYAPWWVSFACFLAGIPVRAGRISQWHSFLFLNHGIRQSRTEAKKHEANYNSDLVEDVYKLPRSATPFLKITADENPHLLEKFHLEKNKYIVVHPGMFGSALNWPQNKYNELISELIKTTKVLISGTKNDERFLTDIKLKWQNHPQVCMTQDQLSMNELLSILKMAKAVIAPSTGVLHIATALGTKAVGIYSPIQVHHPRRWGPRGEDAKILLPENLKTEQCPAVKKCLTTACRFYPCMDTISVSSVLSALGLSS